MRPYFGAALAVALFVLVLFTNVAQAGSDRARVASSSCRGANLRPSRASSAAINTATLCLIDRVRAAHGLPALRTNRELQAVAVSQVRDMIHLNYFADVRPSGQTPATLIAATRYGRHAGNLFTGQNIGWATGGYATPAQMVLTWLRSPTHREIILTAKFSDVGIGASAAAPFRLAHGRAGATYALELATR